MLRIICLALCIAASALSQAQGLESRDRGSADPLLRDMVVASSTTGTLRIDLPGGTYTIGATMGDTSFAQNNMGWAVQGQVVAAGINTAVGAFYNGTKTVTITSGPLYIAFFDPNAYWVVNALTVQQGATYLYKFDFGSDTSPVAAGYTQVTPGTGYAATPGYGWTVDPATQLQLVKVPDTNAAGFPTQSDYMIALERFPLYMERGWHPSSTAGVPGYFGDSSSGELGMRSMGNFIFATALLATDPAYDPTPSGVSQALLLARARECLEYMCRTHVSGDLNRPDGKKWANAGDNWQAAWWTARMAAGAKLMWGQLTPTEQNRVYTVMKYEADRHLTRTAPSGSASDTKSEENAWDTEVLAWTPSMFPADPNAASWRTKGKEFYMNSLSTLADNSNNTMLDGQTIANWVYTTNIHDDYTIENHGAFHSCYMACPIHSFAWGYYGFKSNSQTVPPELFHHARDVYHVMQRTWQDDGRFAYLAGKDWPRYAYGMYFIQPALVMLQNEDDDTTARLFERERFRLFEWEQRQSNDGGYFSKRFTNNVMTGRLLEYETDCEANLGLAYLLHKLKPPPAAANTASVKQALAQPFISNDIKMCLTRDQNWFSSFSWRSLSGDACVSLVTPAGAADMNEWGEDQYLCPFQINGATSANLVRTLLWSKQSALPQNFGTSAIGMSSYKTTGTALLERRTAYAALTPLHRAVYIDQLIATGTVLLNSSASTRMYLPNDMFNGNSRTIKSAAGTSLVTGAGGSASTTNLSSYWINVDNKLGIVRVNPRGSSPTSTFTILDNASRLAPYSSLCYELLELDRQTVGQTYSAGTQIRKSVTIVGCDSSSVTQQLAGDVDTCTLSTTNAYVNVVLVPGDNGKSYLVGANFGTTPNSFSWSVPAGSRVQASSVNFTIPDQSVVVQEVNSAVTTPAEVEAWKSYAALK